MKKYFFCVGVFFISVNHASALSSSSEKNQKKANQMLKKNGIKPDQATIEEFSMKWQPTCENSEGQDDPSVKNDAFIFSAQVQKPITILGLKLNKGTIIDFCHDKVMWLRDNFTSKGERVNFEKDGFTCGSLIGLTKGGRLCECTLGKDTKIDGFLVPAGSNMTLRSGKPYAFIFRASDPRVKDYQGDFFSIKNGKPVPLNKESVHCDFNED